MEEELRSNVFCLRKPGKGQPIKHTQAPISSQLWAKYLLTCATHKQENELTKGFNNF